LMRGGFINQELAGVYSFLPLGKLVINNISNIIREEMSSVGGQEVSMPTLHPKESWQKTGRWDSFDVLFKISSKHGKEYALGPTHEEIIVPLSKRFIKSYKDLPRTEKNSEIWPKSLYQIQTKFRDEKRAKSGLLRGREFLMKDLYSFHLDSEDLNIYYDELMEAYKRVFEKCSLDTILTEASGGSFSKLSHEFQVECQAGEDIIYYCQSCNLARNREIIGDIEPQSRCRECKGGVEEIKSAEVGNIFKLNTKFSEPFDLNYIDEKGKEQLVYMGCYGIGISRLMGVIVESHYDEKGIAWPDNVAPFRVHLIGLEGKQAKSDEVYSMLVDAEVGVLYDDRTDVRAGEKFADADLIGCPFRFVISEKTGERIEIKNRASDKVEMVEISDILNKFKV
jgi:prolyl-tRNA synthetase